MNIENKQFELFLTIKCIDNPWQHKEMIGECEIYGKSSLTKYVIPFELMQNRKKENENLLFKHKIKMKNFANKVMINIRFTDIIKYKYYHLITGNFNKNRLFQLVYNHSMTSHPQFSMNRLATKPVTKITRKSHDKFQVHLWYEDEKRKKRQCLYLVIMVIINGTHYQK